jgi:HJR/Mrr/RecB family endonuclease
VHAIHQAQDWITFVIATGITIFMVWAFVDCASRKAAAFPAAGKLTKPAWMLFTGIPAVFSVLLLLSNELNTTSLLVYIAMIVTSVYMADVRPAVREISGPSRW